MAATQDQPKDSEKQPTDTIPADQFLQVLLATVEKTRGTIGLTLTVGGLVISGDVVPRIEYAKHINQHMNNALGPISDDQPASTKLTDEDVLGQEHVHLKNVQVLTAQGCCRRGVRRRSGVAKCRLLTGSWSVGGHGRRRSITSHPTAGGG